MFNASFTKEKIKLSFPYEAGLVARIKAVEGSKWSPITKTWLLPITLDSIEFVFAENFTFDAKSLKVLDMHIAAIEKREKLKEVNRKWSRALEAPEIPELKKLCSIEPYPFQYVPVHRALANGRARFMLTDSMGSGKSVQAGLIANSSLCKDLPVLIVGPSSVLGNWQAELKKFFGVESIVLTSELKKLDPKIRFYIISYDQLKKQTTKGKKAGNYEANSIFKDQQWFLIFDEAHRIKNTKTKRFQHSKALVRCMENVIFLTGTPIPNRPMELYPILSLLDPNFMSWTAFAKRYCGMAWTPYGLKVSGAENMAELNTLLLENYMIRREKEEILPWLPPKTRKTVEIAKYELPKTKSVLEYFNENAKYKAGNKDFLEWLETAIDSVDKVLVFAHHKIMLDAIEKVCNNNSWKTIRIDGSVDPKDRQPLVDTFQTDKSVKVGILSLTAAGVGLTLTAASTTIFTELYWEPGTNDQAANRVHRPGQTKNVLELYPFLTKFDRDVFKINLDKLANANRIISGNIADSVSQKSLIAQLSEAYGVPPGNLKGK